MICAYLCTQHAVQLKIIATMGVVVRMMMTRETGSGASSGINGDMLVIKVK